MRKSGSVEIRDLEFLLGIPEHKVDLPGEAPPSQNDIFILASTGSDLVSVTVEGKVAESFGTEIVGEWLAKGGHNRKDRIDGLSEILELDVSELTPIWYQLVHRTASALIEAKRYRAGRAMMLVHSFSQTYEHFEDYTAFARLFDVEVARDQIVHVGKRAGKELYLGWVRGEAEYLSR